MKFSSKAIEEHQEVPLGDQGRLEALVEHFVGREAALGPPKEGQNACYVVSVSPRGELARPDAQLDEILGLVEAQGDIVVGHEVYELSKPDPRTLIRKGVAEQIGERARECGANLLVLDAELSPSQARNLEDTTGISISDREAVILNVFERHARTKRARIQVEIAHLSYLRPRIRGLGLNMDQQTGGLTKARGPGETASELLARRLDGRLSDLRRALETLKQSGDVQRKHREECERIVLLGYTNAGKTSLMNALTSAGLSARSRPFETLDTTSRCLTRHGNDVLISDTVGFIRRLPERLFASFESTLAEASEASLLALVVDVADPECAQHLEITEQVLVRLGADAVPRLYVFNKADRLGEELDPGDLARWASGYPYRILSSRDEIAVAELREALLATVRRRLTRRHLFVPYEASGLMGIIYARCRVLESSAEERGMRFFIEADAHVVERIARETSGGQR